MSRSIRPNALDRAGRQADQRAASQALGNLGDRRDAQSAARGAARQVGPVGGSTMTDGPRGLGLGSTPRADRPR